jgi:hypothetical protein
VVALREATLVWFWISLQTFGGPAGQIAVMQRALVDEKRWIGQERFLHALSYCMLLPGPEAQQLAVYIGWLLNGTPGGLIAGILFVLPGLVALLALSAIYIAYGHDDGRHRHPRRVVRRRALRGGSGGHSGRTPRAQPSGIDRPGGCRFLRPGAVRDRIPDSHCRRRRRRMGARPFTPRTRCDPPRTAQRPTERRR